MRAMFVGLALLAPLALAAPAAALPTGSTAMEAPALVQFAQYREESRYCRRLRRACEFKDVRGETGEGNCRRYRRECGRYR
jgi:hypothetical protein